MAFAGFEVPIQMDISAEKMIFGVAGIDPQRRAELIKVLLQISCSSLFWLITCLFLLCYFFIHYIFKFLHTYG